jgi:hypothetical protein
MFRRPHQSEAAKSLADILEEELGSDVGPSGAQASPEAEKQARLRAVYARIHELESKRSALCLSGGGIRSASFGLGVIQALARAGVLEKFDYLSTVSGGGYIGGWLTAWMQNHPAGREGVLADLKTTPDSTLAPEREPIRHLRAFSNYLTPRLGLFSADTWTLGATLVRNVFLNWIVLLSWLGSTSADPALWRASGARAAWACGNEFTARGRIRRIRDWHGVRGHRFAKSWKCPLEAKAFRRQLAGANVRRSRLFPRLVGWVPQHRQRRSFDDGRKRRAVCDAALRRRRHSGGMPRRRLHAHLARSGEKRAASVVLQAPCSRRDIARHRAADGRAQWIFRLVGCSARLSRPGAPRAQFRLLCPAACARTLFRGKCSFHRNHELVWRRRGSRMGGAALADG